jgi:ankyrin repeat protein
VAQILPEKGVDLDPKDENGQTPRLHEAERGHKAIVGLLEAANKR